MFDSNDLQSWGIVDYHVDIIISFDDSGEEGELGVDYFIDFHF